MGRHVVEALARSGCEPVLLARSAGVDLVSRDGLDAALEGVRAVVDVSNLSTQRRAESVGFFEALLPTGSGPRGQLTFDEWLQASVRT